MKLKKQNSYFDLIAIDEYNTLSELDKALIRRLKPKTLIYGNSSLRMHIESQVRLRLENRVFRYELLESFAAGLFFSSSYNRVIKSYEAKNLFKDFLLYEYSSLICCFFLGQLSPGGVYAKNNIIKPASATHNLTMSLQKFERLGYVERIEQKKIHNLTGKFISPTSKRAYYANTKKLDYLMGKFLMVYQAQHEKLTGNIFTIDFEKLKDFKNK